jgi:hypothetical protein
VSALGFGRVALCFPLELLERTRVVVVPRVPFPPVDRMGLPELADVQKMRFEGITFKNTIFLRQGATSESTVFHEMVHVIQWARLGVDRFLLAYGAGLIEFGYEESPLERMAYGLQECFDNDNVPDDVVQAIEAQTDALWEQIAPLVQL